jgi:hypothetical protein
MKVTEVPQDITFYEGERRACYALNDEGKYIIVPSTGWEYEEVVNGLAVNDLAAHLEETRKEVLAGLKSPLCYHMESRQMNQRILAKTAGIAVFRVKRHFRPDVFARLKPSLLANYAKALALSVEELKTVPEKSVWKGNRI